MKKSFLVLIAASVLLASCSMYTCPTYAKKVSDKNEEISEEKI